MMKTILVTGSNGQLGKCIEETQAYYPSYRFVFTDPQTLDITNSSQTQKFFIDNKISWCINCAAYTNVDNAESKKENAYQVNAFGVKNLAEACEKYNVKLIHISTDFVFDGNKTTPYNEEDTTNPSGVYGQSKLKGEKIITSILKQYYIIRTSWLYSQFGHNFLKTMLKLSETRNEINVVSDQVGTPTYAEDLSKVLMTIISRDNDKFGIYHYSNEGIVSWFEFAQKIFELKNLPVKINPIASTEYPTPAQRPKYSVLDKTKIKQAFNIEIPKWEESLKIALNKINE